jgi:redox-sensitive bicupin YhaK (pirin superfamily)
MVMNRLARYCLHPTVGGLSTLDDSPRKARAAYRPSWPWIALGGVALLVIASAALATRPGASAPSSPAQPRIEAPAARELPVADHGWVRMRDHRTITLGAHAGEGAPLGALLVAADTTLAAGASFPAHPHAGIDVVTLVVDGTLSLDEGGRSTELPAGTVQVIAAGAGMVHAEANHGARPVRFLQLWLASPVADRAPASEQLGPAAAAELAPLPLHLLAPDVQLRRATLAPGASLSWTVARGRVAYLICAGGELDVDTVHLADGDGATLADGHFVAAAGGAGPAQLVVVDVPAPADLAR